MATPDEIRPLEFAVREAERALAAARAENVRADEAWARMVRQAEAQMAAGRSVSAEFIIGSAERARRDGAGQLALDKVRGNNVIRGLMNAQKDKLR
jgi:hypothetical protein